MADPKDADHDPLRLSDQAKAQLEADPELAEALKEMFANMRQAHWAWKQGHYASFDDALEAITGTRPVPVEDDDDDQE